MEKRSLAIALNWHFFVRDFLNINGGTATIRNSEDYVSYMQSLFAALGNYIQENDGAYQLFYSSILWEKGDEKKCENRSYKN